MKKKAKVLHILWSGGIGGTEEYITSLFGYFDPTKYDIYLCFISEKGEIFEDASKMSNNVAYIGIRNGFDILGGLKLFRYLYRKKFDVIHLHTPNILSNLTVYLFRKTRKVITEHVSPGAKDLFKKRKIFYYLFSGTFQRVIVISEFVRQKLIKHMRIDPGKITVIYDGIRTDKYHDSILPSNELNYIKESNKYILGFIGRMVDFKRPNLFVEVAAEILKRNKNFCFIMIGDGPELARCRKLINEYRINEYFNLLGFRRDIPNLLKLFDALLFTSSGEGFGVVLLEAMSMGIPVFAVNEGSVPEIIQDRKNGILLNTTDAKNIALQFLKNIKNEALMNKIKKKCVEDVSKRFSVKVCAQKTESVYREILSDTKA
jgi:glycosyltransferase involved in cell wall biosynthesis